MNDASKRSTASTRRALNAAKEQASQGGTPDPEAEAVRITEEAHRVKMDSIRKGQGK